MSEIWKPIPGYEGYYEVSDKGRVKRIAGWRLHGRATMFFEDRLRKPVENGRGYLQVTLSRDGKHHSIGVHRLVMLAHVGPRPDGMQVCHNDGNKTNATLTNLRYDTQSGNQRDRVSHGTDLRGTKHPSAKLDDEKVCFIRSLPSPDCDSLAVMFGVTPQAIKCVIKRKTWRHVT